MTTRRTILVGAAALAMAPRVWAQGRSLVWPTGSAWPTIDPKTAGFDPVKLTAAVQAAIADRSTSVMVLRDGKIVNETYGQGGGVAVSREIASAGKSMVSTLTGCCLDEGKIKSLDQSASDFFPQWKGTPKAAITVKHLISMTSGLDDAGLLVRNVTGDQEALNAAAPQLAPPGTQWHYNTPVYHLMFHLVARAAGEPFDIYAKRKLLDPLGMTGTTWLSNKGRDPAGKEVTNFYTALCTARDLARFGMMGLGGGAFNGRTIVSNAYFKAATSPSQDLNGAYGYLWWENAKPAAAGGAGNPRYIFDGSPLDTFAALGAAGQNVVVVPSQGLVIIRQGGAPQGPASQQGLTAAVVAALETPPVVARSPS